MRTSWDPKSPSLLPTIVCYADILGFRDMTERAFKLGEERSFLQRIKCSLAAAYEEMRNSAALGGADDRILDIQLFDMKVFTDNIVVAYPLRDPNRDVGEPELGALLALFAHAQASLAADGFFLRGAITVGQHYQDEDIAYGDALLEAVDLNKSKMPPRLAIGASVEPLISEHLSRYGGGWAPHHEQLIEDSGDGRFFLDYLGVAFEHFPDGPIDHELLAAHSQKVRSGLSEFESNPEVLPKYKWSATYHNYVCCTFAEKYPDLGDAEADPYEMAVAEEAQSVLDHLVPFKAKPAEQQPRPLDAQRLQQRLAIF